jgi:hypothetical protein
MNRRTPKALQILASTVAPLFLAPYAAGQSAGISDFWSLIRFTALNEVWPSATVVGMSGSHGEQVRLLQKSNNAGARARLPEAYLEDLRISGQLARHQIGGYSAVEVSAPEKAGLAFIDDTTVWVLLAEGVNALKLLNEVASGWKAVKK